MSNGQTMLIAFDGSDESTRALEYAAKLLKPGVVEILTAWEPAARQAARAVSRGGMHQSTLGADVNVPEEDEAYTEAKELCRQGVAVAESLGLAGRAHLVEVSTNIAAAIVEAAQELDVDVIVTGTRGLTGLRAWWNSSTAEHLVRNSEVPVFVVPPEDEEEDEEFTG